jgi:hypothetical protein
MKNLILKILAFIWFNILPLLLVIAFNIGIFFNLWKEQMLPIWLSASITLLTTAFLIFAFGKLLKKW